MIVTAYQTLEDRNNIEEIETNGPFKCTRSDAWLGHGYYFWDSNIKWAVEWGINSFKRRNRHYVIGKCKIDLSKSCFDLYGTVNHQQELRETIEVLKDSGKIKVGNRLVLPIILEFLKKEGLFPYKSIRIGDNYDPLPVYFGDRRGEFLLLNQRV
jgi:hypothetical protein